MLYRSRDGLNWEFITEFRLPGNTWNASETTLRIMPDGEMIALTRPHWIGTSTPPDKSWSWTKMKENIGGPNFVRLPDGSLWAAGRRYGKEPTTVLARMTRDRYEPILTLPSGGDCSYPGMVWHDGMLWMSYYSSHEGKTSVYLAKIKISEQQAGIRPSSNYDLDTGNRLTARSRRDDGIDHKAGQTNRVLEKPAPDAPLQREKTAVTLEEARVAVTVHDINRPDPFPGAGDFGWAGNVQRLDDGRLLMVCRPDGGLFHSADEGVTWSETGRIPVTGTFKAPCLFVLSDGTVVCAATVGTLCVFLSSDHGRTWTESIILDKSAYGYPGGLNFEDDSLLVSYVERGNAPSRIYIVRFRVNESRNGIELVAAGSSPGAGHGR